MGQNPNQTNDPNNPNQQYSPEGQQPVNPNNPNQRQYPSEGRPNIPPYYPPQNQPPTPPQHQGKVYQAEQRSQQPGATPTPQPTAMPIQVTPPLQNNPNQPTLNQSVPEQTPPTTFKDRPDQPRTYTSEGQSKIPNHLNDYTKFNVIPQLSDESMSKLISISGVIFIVLLSIISFVILIDAIKGSLQTITTLGTKENSANQGAWVLLSIAFISLFWLVGFIFYSTYRDREEDKIKQQHNDLYQKHMSLQQAYNNQQRKIQLANGPATQSMPSTDPKLQAIKPSDFTKPVDNPKPISIMKPVDYQVHEVSDFNELKRYPHTFLYPELDKNVKLQGGWYIAGASRRGKIHAHEAKFREDAFAIKIINQGQAALVAIADGLGTKSLSRHGAVAATSGATSEQIIKKLMPIIKSFAQADAHKRKEYYANIRSFIATDIFQASQDAVKEKVREDNASEDALHSTLQIWIVVPIDQGKRIAVLGSQSGDGAIYVRKTPNAQVPQERWDTFLEQQVAGPNNAVVPFMKSTSEMWLQEFRATEYTGDFIMGMTDGTADDIIPPRDPSQDPYLYVDQFGNDLAATCAKADNPNGAAIRLLDYLDYDAAQSDDDRTVVCFYRRTK